MPSHAFVRAMAAIVPIVVVELPGAPEPPMTRADIPAGELEFGFHCHIESAGFDVDDVLVRFPPAKVWHEEQPRAAVERIELSLLAFDDERSASAVLAAYDADDTTDCLGRTFGEPVHVETDDPLDARGISAKGFKVSIGAGEVQPEGHRTFAAVVGPVLVDVTVLAPDEDRGRELAAGVLDDVIELLGSRGG